MDGVLNAKLQMEVKAPCLDEIELINAIKTLNLELIYYRIHWSNLNNYWKKENFPTMSEI